MIVLIFNQQYAINPRVIVTLGRFSMHRYLPNAKISQVHGQTMRVKGHLVCPMYHPAAALHQPSLRSVLEADFIALPEIINKAAEAVEYDEPANNENQDDAQQLSMF